jgi:hypothetical protein
MRKLKLDLEHLTVESFDTEPTAAGEGTVEAHGRTITVECGTCEVSCNPSNCYMCPSDGGFHTECCTENTACCSYGCDTSEAYTCGEACTAVCP